MSARQSKAMAMSVPFVVTLILMQDVSGAAQAAAAAGVAIVTTAGVLLAAHFLWRPILQRVGFWVSSLLMAGALVVGVGAAIALAGVLGGSRGVWALLMKAGAAGILFSWVLAAMRGAQESKTT